MDKERVAWRALGALTVTAALLGGCAAPAWRPSAPAPNPTPTPTPAAPPERPTPLSPAARSLIVQARTLERRGDLDGASATLDRALRIEPYSPQLWIALGRLRLIENDAHQAENCARKALALARGDPGARAEAGRLLAAARRADPAQKPH